MMSDEEVIELMRAAAALEPAVTADAEAVLRAVRHRRKRRRTLAAAGATGLLVAAGGTTIGLLQSDGAHLDGAHRTLAVESPTQAALAHPRLGVGIAPACDESAEMVTSAGPGSPATGIGAAKVGGTMQVEARFAVAKAVDVLQAQVIVATPGSTAEAGASAGPHAPSTSMLLSSNQVSRASESGPPAASQAALTATARFSKLGDYPVFYTIEFVDQSCASDPGPKYVAGYLGVIHVSP